MKLPKEVMAFFDRQNFVIVSSIDDKGLIHCSAKGTLGFNKEGQLLVADLYLQQTHKNVSQEPHLSVTAIEEYSFKGFTLQGKASIVPREEIPTDLRDLWESRIIRRMSQRVMKGVQAQASSAAHHEAGLPPQPQYLMAVEVDKIIDLSPPALRGSHSG